MTKPKISLEGDNLSVIGLSDKNFSNDKTIHLNLKDTVIVDRDFLLTKPEYVIQRVKLGSHGIISDCVFLDRGTTTKD